MIDGIAKLFPQRAALDAMDRICRVQLGDQEYILRVLPAAANQRFREKLERSLDALLTDVQDDQIGLMATIARISGIIPEALDLLELYDQDNVLPPREQIYETQDELTILQAVLGVWAAANPAPAIALMTALGMTMDGLTTSVSGAPTSISPTPITGDLPTRSGNGSPTRSSSASSTLPRIGKNGAPAPTSRRRSKPSGSGRSSPKTARPSTAGGTDPVSTLSAAGPGAAASPASSSRRP